MSTLKLFLVTLISAMNAFRAYARHQRAKDLANAQREQLRLEYEIVSSTTNPSVPGAKLVLLNAEAAAISEYIQFLNSESLQGASGDGGDDTGRADSPTTRISERGDSGVLSGESGVVPGQAAADPITLTPRQVRVPRTMPTFPSDKELEGSAAMLVAGGKLVAPTNTWVVSIKPFGADTFGREHYQNTPAAAHLAFNHAKGRYPDGEIWLSDPGEELPK